VDSILVFELNLVFSQLYIGYSTCLIHTHLYIYTYNIVRIYIMYTYIHIRIQIHIQMMHTYSYRLSSTVLYFSTDSYIFSIIYVVFVYIHLLCIHTHTYKYNIYVCIRTVTHSLNLSHIFLSLSLLHACSLSRALSLPPLLTRSPTSLQEDDSHVCHSSHAIPYFSAKRALYTVALLRKMTFNLRHPMPLRHPVLLYRETAHMYVIHSSEK